MNDSFREMLPPAKAPAAQKDNTNLSEICRRVWEFLYNHIQYKLDKRGVEQLRQPARSWEDRHTGIDCDCFSIFVSSILCNLGIEHKFRITKYGGKPNFQHVYVVVPNGTDEIIIDCVLSKFNYEKPYSEKKDFIMKPTVNGLNGIDIAMLSGTPRSLGDVIDDVKNQRHFQQIENPDNATLAYLQDLRLIITHKPQLCNEPKVILKMLDYLIKHWNTPYCEQALENICKDENTLNGLGSFGKLFKKIAANKAVKQQAKTERKVAKKQAKVEKKAVKKQAKVAKKVAKQEGKTARKIAKQEAKTARKVARQETKQARINSRIEKKALKQENRTARAALRKGNQPIPEQPEIDQDDTMVDDEPMSSEPTPDNTPIQESTPSESEPTNSTTPQSYRYPTNRRNHRRHWEFDDDEDDDFDDEGDDWDDEDDFDEDEDDDFDEDDEDDFDDENDIDGMVEGNLGSSKKALKKERKAAKKQAKAEKKVEKREEKARIKALPRKQRLKERVKKVAKTIVKFNPLTVASRGGVLVAMKMNIGKMASKLKWGYATQADVDAGKLTAAQWEASKKALSKVENIFCKIGGDKAKLKIAVVYGKGGKGSLKSGELGLVCDLGLGEVATGAAIAAAVPVIVTIVKALKDAGIMKGDEAESALTLLKNPETAKELESGYADEVKQSSSDPRMARYGENSFFEKNKIPILIGTAALGLGLFAMSKGNKKALKPALAGLSGAKIRIRKPKKIIL
jgi:exonuclease VII large subunit